MLIIVIAAVYMTTRPEVALVTTPAVKYAEIDVLRVSQRADLSTIAVWEFKLKPGVKFRLSGR